MKAGYAEHDRRARLKRENVPKMDLEELSCKHVL
jgi:hypothetical protein